MSIGGFIFRSPFGSRAVSGALLAACLVATAGCYAPLCSPGIPAASLPDTFRADANVARAAQPLYSRRPAGGPYRLGTGDVLEITIPDLLQRGAAHPMRIEVLDTGEIFLPRVGPVPVGGMSLAEAQHVINLALANGFLQTPAATMTLIQKGTVNVLVLGSVREPGVHALSRDESDIGHAVAAAGGLGEYAGEVIEVHRRCANAQGPVMLEDVLPHSAPKSPLPPEIVRIPLRGIDLWSINAEDARLAPGDVVVVPDRIDEVFYVVGKLSETNRVRFSVNDRDREIGNGFVLPSDREVDVVTAVAMAGYIDPIESPTTVTVHRLGPDGCPLLVRVDLIAARSDPQETILIQPGDIIYLNPDPWWYTRRTLDRVVNQALGTAVGRWLTD